MRPFVTLVFGFACSNLLLSSCSKNHELTNLEGFAQGTTYHLTYSLPNPNERATLETEVTTELQRIDKSISNYRQDSTIELFNAQQDTEPHEVNEEIVKLVEQARIVSKASGGCYDLTVKPLFELWGFKKDSFNLPDDKSLRENLKLVGMEKLITVDASHLQKTLPDLRLDLSSIGQGYSVGRLADILERYGVENYIVEIGGELKTRGKKPDGKPWRIAMEKPLPNERKLEKIAAFNSGEPMSLMTSGTYRHYFDNNGKRYSHILDARSGKPVEHSTVSVAVLNKDPTIADAWSTALLCLGSEEGTRVANENGIAALYVDQEGEQLIEKSTLPLEKLTGVRLEAVHD